jgi:disulfide bond formation protein DsbB
MFVLFYFYAIVILGTVAVPATSKEAFMNSKIVSVALSLAMALSGASVAMAGGKKAPVDPRVAYQAHPDKTLEMATKCLRHEPGMQWMGGCRAARQSWKAQTLILSPARLARCREANAFARAGISIESFVGPRAVPWDFHFHRPRANRRSG